MRSYIKVFFAGLVIMIGTGICLTTITLFGNRPTEQGEQELQDDKSEKIAMIRNKLLQAVENAKKGDRRELGIMIDFVEKDKGVYIIEKMLPDFFSFLNEKDSQIQLLGAKGLYVLKNPKSKEALFEYLRGKDFDFDKMEEMVSSGIIDGRHATWEVYAYSIAIATVGKLGDKSAIPLLESIRQKANFELEWGNSPVEEVLAELGAVGILSNIPPGSDEGRIRRAARAIRKIGDPNKVPELMAVVYDVNCAPPIRYSALEALGNIKTVGVPEFLLSVINDSQVPVSMRRTAVWTAAQTGNEIFEEKLLKITDPNSEIRTDGLCGLALLKPDKYLKNIFRMIRDVNESDEFRNTLVARLILYIPWQQKQQMLEGQKGELYSCLNTNKKDGSPHDEIRIRIWELINKFFGEEPAIVLSSRSSQGLSTLKSIIQGNLQQQWRDEPWNEPSVEELEKMTEEKFKSIVTFLPEDSEK